MFQGCLSSSMNALNTCKKKKKQVGNKIRLAKKAVCNVKHPHKDVFKTKSIGMGKKRNLEIKKLEVEIEQVKGSLLTDSMSDKTIALLQLYYGNAILIPPIWKG